VHPPFHPHRPVLLLLLALTLVRGLIYASVIPPWWQGHDEEYHFAQVKLLADRWLSDPTASNPNWLHEMMATLAFFPQGRWSPNPEGQINMANPPVRYTTVGRPSLSYYPYAWLDQWLRRQDILFQLFTLRFVSVITTCAIVAIAFLCARQIFSDSLLSQILVPWLIAFNPSFMVTGSTISDANLAILLTTIVFYLLLLEVSQGPTWWRLPLALSITIVALTTKATTLFLLPVWGLLLVRYAWRWGRTGRLWLALLGGTLFTALLFMPARFQALIGTFKSIMAKSGGILSDGVAYAFSTTFFWDNFTFFWIILGWSTYRLTQVWYLFLFLFLLLAILGLLRYSWAQFKASRWGAEQKSLLLTFLFVGVSVGILIGLGLIRYDEQEGRSARYIFPIIVPLSILLVTGWRELLPTSWRNVGLVALAAAFFLFDTLVWLDFALPWYYPFWPN
jgi:4-amino-4-deoxy-L-arabinose transferase-like glycosyltransferase